MYFKKKIILILIIIIINTKLIYCNIINYNENKNYMIENINIKNNITINYNFYCFKNKNNICSYIKYEFKKIAELFSQSYSKYFKKILLINKF